jgi:glucokinase
VTHELAIGLDLGGTKILAALVDTSGSVVRHEAIATEAADGPERVIERIYDLLKSQLSGPLASGVRAIGLCSPGPIDAQSGVVVLPPNLPGWTNVPLRRLVTERFGLPTTLEKDVNAAAFAELRCGAGRGFEHAVYVAAGTGIGGALVVGGEIVRGTGFAGEIGHMRLVADGGPTCGCGATGCLEALASGTGIARAASELASADLDFPLHPRLAEGRALSAGDVVAAAEAGDERSAEIIRAAGRYLGLGIASLINLMSPEVVIVGGGLLALGDRYIGPARSAAEKSSYVQGLRPARIAITPFPETAGALGAALIAVEALHRRPAA